MQNQESQISFSSSEELSIDEIKARVAASACAAGATKWDIFGAFSEDTSVQVQEQKPHQTKASQSSSITVRAWNSKNQTGVASVNSLTPAALRSAFEVAMETANFAGANDNSIVGADAKSTGEGDEECDFSPRACEQLSHAARVPGLSITNNEVLELNEMFKLLAKAERQAIDSHPAIVSLPYNGLSQRKSTRFYLNSAGAMRNQETGIASCYLYTRTEQEGKKPRSAGLSKVSHSVNALNIEQLTSKVAEKTLSFLNYKAPPSGGYLTVFSAEAFLSLVEAFSNIFNARNVLDKRSLSEESSLGRQIASSWLTISDNPLHPENASAKNFDGEGTPTQETVVLKDGKLVSFLHSAGTAKKMNAVATGNANLGSKITVSSHFWQVSPGIADSDSLDHPKLEEQNALVLVDEVHSLHAGVNELQGSFSLPFSGWIYENGKRTSIESATVAGDFLTLLKDICYVEEEVEVTADGVCPRVWVKSLSITSESDGDAPK